MNTSIKPMPISATNSSLNLEKQNQSLASANGKATSRPANAPVTGVHDTVITGLDTEAVLRKNSSIFSPNMEYELVMQADGNLAFYRLKDRKMLWSTGTAGSSAAQAVMHTSGNLVLYTAGRVPGQRDRVTAVKNIPSLSDADDSNQMTKEKFKQLVSSASLSEKSNGTSRAVTNVNSAQANELIATRVWSSNSGGHYFSHLQLTNDGNVLVINNKQQAVWDVQRLLANDAKNNIAEMYRKIGGKASPLGLPSSEVLKQGENFVQYYRSGFISTNGVMDNKATAVQTNRVQIFFTGIECRIRQESQDEIYGTVSAFTPSSGANIIHHFPDGQEYWTLGEDAPRIVQSNAMICDSVAGDIFIVCSLVEHDSGNIDEYKKKVADLITKAAKAFADMEGVPAETMASDQGLIGDISLSLVNVISGAIGADDDQYNSGSIKIDKEEIFNKFKSDLTAPDQFPKFLLQRDDDPRTLPYTHRIFLSGTDQGGDTGEYALYFEVRLISTWEIINPI